MWLKLELEPESKLWTKSEPEAGPKINNFGSRTLEEINILLLRENSSATYCTVIKERKNKCRNWQRRVIKMSKEID